MSRVLLCSKKYTIIHGRTEMEFLFEFSTRYLTSERSKQVRYRKEHELSVFVGFSFDKSFNIFVCEGHESFIRRMFGRFFWCIARGHLNLLVVQFLFSERAKWTDIENYGIRANRCQKWRERRHVKSRKLIGHIFTCKTIVILHVPSKIFLSDGNLYKTRHSSLYNNRFLQQHMVIILVSIVKHTESIRTVDFRFWAIWYSCIMFDSADVTENGWILCCNIQLTFSVFFLLISSSIH